jgi:ADP-heptose:LPS heptosyltransferase
MTFWGKIFGVIFIWRRGAMGDVLWLEPLLAEQAKIYRKIYFYTQFPELFQNHPASNLKIRFLPSFLLRVFFKAEKFLGSRFMFLNLNGACEKYAKKHLLWGYFEYMHIKRFSPRYPTLFLSEDEMQFYKNSPKFIVLALQSFSNKNYRQVYGIDWNTIIEYLKSRGFRVLIIGKGLEYTYGAEYVKTDIRELISLINNAEFFIGLDSGPSHIAAALQKKCIIFFGSVNPYFRHLLDDFNGLIMQSPCEFAGCYHEAMNEKEVECRLVGNTGIPKCSIHDNASLIKNIEKLLQ